MYHRIQELAKLFEGYGEAYGAYKLTGETKDRKVLGKAYSLKGTVTLELWHDHLVGKQGLGIIPINEDSKVRFAAIDVDTYPLDPKRMNDVIRSEKLPVILCRTKSGGIHIYLFLKEWVDAKKVTAKMGEIAALLGVGGSEIFPKQTKIMVERGDIGQWINMPYFLATTTSRPALDEFLNHLTLDKFLDRAQKLQLTEQQVHDLEIGKESLVGGPPCLQHLVRQGFPDGTRNNGLFNLGVYARKRFPDDWERAVEDYNHRFMKPPLSMIEVTGIIRSLRKKDFFYTCEQQPIKAFCDKDKCRMCEYGIGGVPNGFPRLGTLSKLCTDPPIWFIEVEGGGRLELTSEDLQNQRSFQLKCMAILNVMPVMPKADIWQGIVSKLLETVTLIQVPREATPEGMLWQYLEDFCTSKVQAKTREEMLLGKPYTHEGFTHFRMRDLQTYLDRVKFRYYEVNQIAMRLENWGCDRKFMNLMGKGVNVYIIKEFKNRQNESFPTKGEEKKPYE